MRARVWHGTLAVAFVVVVPELNTPKSVLYGGEAFVLQMKHLSSPPCPHALSLATHMQVAVRSAVLTS